jgi:hypothetical protein
MRRPPAVTRAHHLPPKTSPRHLASRMESLSHQTNNFIQHLYSFPSVRCTMATVRTVQISERNFVRSQTIGIFSAMTLYMASRTSL